MSRLRTKKRLRLSAGQVPGPYRGVRVTDTKDTTKCRVVKKKVSKMLGLPYDPEVGSNRTPSTRIAPSGRKVAESLAVSARRERNQLVQAAIAAPPRHGWARRTP